MRSRDDVLEVYLQPGDFYFGEGATRIRTLLGSCVAITMWHPRLHVGGMCHYLLPRRPRPAGGEALDGRFAEEAMELFLAEMRRIRTRPGEYEVKLFGGGNMFREVKITRRHVNISERNVEAGRRILAEHGLRLAAEDLGGGVHRNVILDLWSGDVWIRRPPAAFAGNGPAAP